MRQKLLNIWSSFVRRWICDDDPETAKMIEDYKKADAINKDIMRLWRDISNAEHHYEFIILDIEIQEFKEHYAGVDDFEMIVAGIEEHLSDRIETVQGVWQIE